MTAWQPPFWPRQTHRSGPASAPGLQMARGRLRTRSAEPLAWVSRQAQRSPFRVPGRHRPRSLGSSVLDWSRASQAPQDKREQSHYLPAPRGPAPLPAAFFVFGRENRSPCSSWCSRQSVCAEAAEGGEPARAHAALQLEGSFKGRLARLGAQGCSRRVTMCLWRPRTLPT